MNSEVLHVWPIGVAAMFSVAAVFSVGASLFLARSMPWWVADVAHAGLLARSRAYQPVLLGLLSLVLALVALLLFPTALTSPPDRLLLALILGVSAAATPFLFLVDIVVHRLPDRIVYLLIGTEVLACVLGQIFGESRIWVLGLVAGTGAALFFGVLHLIGRLLHVRTMGLGDVKLAFVVFLTPTLFSPWAPALVFVIMMLIAGVGALFAAASRRSLAGTTIAFGPAMLSGMWFGAVLSPFLL